MAVDIERAELIEIETFGKHDFVPIREDRTGWATV